MDYIFLENTILYYKISYPYKILHRSNSHDIFRFIIGLMAGSKTPLSHDQEGVIHHSSRKETSIVKYTSSRL